MNAPLDQHLHPLPLNCSYSSEYQSIYEPGYETGFIFTDEEELDYDDEFAEDIWVDIGPMPDSSGIGRA